MENGPECSNTLIVVCAWCGRRREAGVWVEASAPAGGVDVSHGMCEACAELVLRDLPERGVR